MPLLGAEQVKKGLATRAENRRHQMEQAVAEAGMRYGVHGRRSKGSEVAAAGEALRNYSAGSRLGRIVAGVRSAAQRGAAAVRSAASNLAHRGAPQGQRVEHGGA